MELFDSHAHYNDEKFVNDRDNIINDIYKFGVKKLINAGYNIESSKLAFNIAKNYNWIYCTCGISPNDIPNTKEEIDKQVEELKKFVIDKNKEKSKKIVAIGEIGLDYYWNKDNKELQKYAFIKQIELANELNLPIVIHTREAINDTIDILKNQIKVKRKGVFHCCPLNFELVKQAQIMGFYVSFAGPITFKNSKNADEIINMVALDKMLIETDSPYLTPEPNRGKRNDSRNLYFTAGKIANVKKLNIEDVASKTYENAMKIFEIK